MFAEEECIVNSSIRKFFIRPPPSQTGKEAEEQGRNPSSSSPSSTSSSSSSSGVYTMIDHRFTELFCLLEPRSNLDPEGDSNYWRKENHEFENLSVLSNGVNNRLTTGNSSSSSSSLLQENFWKHGASCIGNRRVHTLSMDYLLQFMDNYEGLGNISTLSLLHTPYSTLFLLSLSLSLLVLTLLSSISQVDSPPFSSLEQKRER
jgi:hypothetical protein